jgi:hypothetical protein
MSTLAASPQDVAYCLQVAALVGPLRHQTWGPCRCCLPSSRRHSGCVHPHPLEASGKLYRRRVLSYAATTCQRWMCMASVADAPFKEGHYMPITGNQKSLLCLLGRTRLQCLQPNICMVSVGNVTFPERCACNEEELAHTYSHKYMPHHTLLGTSGLTHSVTRCV